MEKENSNEHKDLNSLIDSLISKGILSSEKVAHVMRTVDRADFIDVENPYNDCA